MATEMSVDVVRRMCMEKDLYRTPDLNDKLYLHFMGFERIANIEEYVNVKSIFLEGNALVSLRGLAPHCSQLRCIFAQQNCLLALDDLEGLDDLDTLNVSNNAIKSLTGIEVLPRLTTLQITHNKLRTSADLLALLACPSLTVVDLSHNMIDDDEVGAKVLFKMPKLACLYLQGNPVVGTMRHYRKTMVVNVRTLNYLDDRPVFEKERRLCDAWQVGGIEAERQERASIRREEDEKDRENFEYLKMIREKAMAMRTGAGNGDAANGTDRDTGSSTDDDDDNNDNSDNDDDSFSEPAEPPELVAARLKLASYPARAGEEEPADLIRARVHLHEQAQQTRASGVNSDCEASDKEGRTFGIIEVDDDEDGGGVSTDASTASTAEAVPPSPEAACNGETTLPIGDVGASGAPIDGRGEVELPNLEDID